MTPERARPRTCILVLGPPGSGSSALSGVLDHLGVDTPLSAQDPGPESPAGAFASRKLHALHEALLASAGTSWQDWQRFSPGWFESPVAAEFREKALEILAQEWGNSHLFLLHDPCICRLMPFWKAVLAAAGIRPAVLHIHRSPLDAVAARHSSGMPEPDYAPLLWLRHVLEAEHQSRDLPRCFTSLRQMMEEWPRLIAAAQEPLQLRWPRFSENVADTIEAFLSSQPQAGTQVPPGPLSPSWLRDTFEILEQWSADGENPADHALLDAIRVAFDATGPVFGGLIVKGQAAGRQLAANIAALETAEQAGAALSAQVVVQTQALADLEAQHAAALDALEAHCQAEAALEATLRATTEAREAEFVASRAEMKRLSDRVEQLEQKRAARERDVTAAADNPPS